MPLNKNNVGLSERNIFNNESERDQNLMFKNNDNGDYLFKDNTGALYMLEVRSFMDKDNNGGCWQRKIYFTNRDTYQRTGVITNKTISWSGWVLLIDADDVATRDNRMAQLEARERDINNKYNDAVNRSNNAVNRANQVAGDINYARSRADDAWNRTQDIYNWAIRDIRLAGYQYLQLGGAVWEASGYVITGIVNDGAGMFTDGDHVQRRVLQKLVNGTWYNSYFA